MTKKTQENRPHVCRVLPGSIAEEAGISSGDIILTINGEKIEDVFDYRFLITEENLDLIVEKSNGDVWEISIDKDTYEDLGIEFDDPMLDKAKKCSNKCIFCFIDQLPKGMRETLYFKDDDTRLSFLMGNYVTLTNVEDKDIDRIIRYHMSPINISVHTTNPSLRRFMLGNKFAGHIMKRIKKLTDAGITVNCQIVLCRGINDDKELDKTISHLSSLYPGVRSISVVPVGITKYREGLFNLLPYDKEEASNVLIQIDKWQNKLLVEKGSRVVYLADEFYIMADCDIPEYEEYEDFPQLENGVGLVSMLRYEFYEYLSKLKTQSIPNGIEWMPNRIVSIATGICAYRVIKGLAEILEKGYNNLKVNVYPIENIFFGKHVTVAGLLTGQDIISQLKDKELGQVLMVPEAMLKAGENVFLDNYTVDMMEEMLGTKVKVVEISGEAFINELLGDKWR